MDIFDFPPLPLLPPSSLIIQHSVWRQITRISAKNWAKSKPVFNQIRFLNLKMFSAATFSFCHRRRRHRRPMPHITFGRLSNHLTGVLEREKEPESQKPKFLFPTIIFLSWKTTPTSPNHLLACRWKILTIFISKQQQKSKSRGHTIIKTIQ